MVNITQMGYFVRGEWRLLPRFKLWEYLGVGRLRIAEAATSVRERLESFCGPANIFTQRKIGPTPTPSSRAAEGRDLNR